MSLCLAKCIRYALEKVDHIIYFKANILTTFSILNVMNTLLVVNNPLYILRTVV